MKPPFDLIIIGKPENVRESISFACEVVDLVDRQELTTQEGVYLVGAFYLNAHAEKPRPL